MSVSVALKSISQSFNWTTSEEGSLGGILLGIFLVSYGISNIFLSPFIDKIGAKKVLSISILSWSLTLVLASIFGHLYPMLLLSRVLLGLSQGVLFPVANKITASWFSESKRALATTAFLSGGPIGSLLTPLIVVPIIVKSSWQVSFYFISILGIALIPFVVYFIKDNPTGQKQQKKDDVYKRQ
ncbi:MAG: MFS transporter [Thermococcus sp.]|nr:MFS transporter [Thermococcus sp.]